MSVCLSVSTKKTFLINKCPPFKTGGCPHTQLLVAQRPWLSCGRQRPSGVKITLLDMCRPPAYQVYPKSWPPKQSPLRLGMSGQPRRGGQSPGQKLTLMGILATNTGTTKARTYCVHCVQCSTIVFYCPRGAGPFLVSSGFVCPSILVLWIRSRSLKPVLDLKNINGDLNS